MSKFRIFTSIMGSIFAAHYALANAPQIPPNSLYKPTFSFKTLSQVQAGTAFAVTYREHRFIVTAHHLFGPAGGLERQLSAEEIRMECKSIQLRDLLSDEVITGGNYLSQDDVQPTSISGGASRDIALFSGFVPAGGLQMSDISPKEGDLVWLFAKSKDADDMDLLHAASVIFIDENTIFYRFHNRRINLRATSGAPILNSEGKVVAVNTAAIVVPYMIAIGLGGTTFVLQKQMDDYIAVQTSKVDISLH